MVSTIFSSAALVLAITSSISLITPASALVKWTKPVPYTPANAASARDWSCPTIKRGEVGGNFQKIFFTSMSNSIDPNRDSCYHQICVGIHQPSSGPNVAAIYDKTMTNGLDNSEADPLWLVDIAGVYSRFSTGPGRDVRPFEYAFQDILTYARTSKTFGATHYEMMYKLSRMSAAQALRVIIEEKYRLDLPDNCAFFRILYLRHLHYVNAAIFP